MDTYKRALAHVTKEIVLIVCQRILICAQSQRTILKSALPRCLRTCGLSSMHARDAMVADVQLWCATQPVHPQQLCRTGV